MSVINKVSPAPGTTHTFKDTVSGYGIFSASQGLSPSATGATLVATIKYRTFNTTTINFNATTTVNLYSTSSSAAGNNWVATVVGTDLQLNNSGAASSANSTASGGGGDDTI